MPTFNIYVSPYKNKKEERRVCIRITQFKKHAYIDTGLTVVDQQLKAGEIKDNDILFLVLNQIREYKSLLMENVGIQITSMSALKLKEYILNKTSKPAEINFIEVCMSHAESLEKEGRKGRARRVRTIANTLSSFWGNKLYIKDLKYDFLVSFEKYLRSKHVISFTGRYGSEVKKSMPPLTNTSIHDYMSDIKTLFNIARQKYNDEDAGFITIAHNPFAKYKICQTNVSKKNNIDITAIRQIMNYECKSGEEIAKDVFMLSFFLVGINSIDLYNLPFYALKGNRISYNRSKTKRRKDKAYISIKVEPEMERIIKKYRDPLKERLFSFHRMFPNAESFNSALNRKLKSIKRNLQIDERMTFYAARKSWATIAHNTLGYTVYDIAECLNHVTPLKVTEGYIEKDFSRIDKINREMINLLFEEE